MEKDPHRERLGTLYAAPVWQREGIAFSTPAQRVVSLHLELQKDLAQSYSEAALTCFEKIREILEERSSGKVLLQIVVSDTAQNALLLGLSGLLRTAAIENLRLAGQILLSSAQTGSQELLAQLQAEQGAAQDRIVRYSQGSREVLRLQELDVGGQPAEVAFKDDGVYLITGGLGGLGVLFAREILRQAAHAKIILTGRSELSEEKRRALESLCERSGAVEYERLDVTDAGQVRALIQRIVAEKKQLNGIFHAAGMTADNFILKKTSEEFRRVLEPKVAGTVNLDEASREMDLDFMVLFSSAAAVMGNTGQADYTAANGFLDQFASYRNEQVAAGQRRGKTLSINWPLWRDGGMTVDPETAELFRERSGIVPLSTEAGMRAFYRSLALQPGQILVLSGDLPKLRAALLYAHAAPAWRAPAAIEKTEDEIEAQLAALFSA